MQHRTRSPGPRHRQVDACLGGGPTRASDNSACFIDLHDVLSGETPLLHAAGGDRQPKGVTRDHRAEVATGPQYPATGVTLAPDLGERIGHGGEGHAQGYPGSKAKTRRWRAHRAFHRLGGMYDPTTGSSGPAGLPSPVATEIHVP